MPGKDAQTLKDTEEEMSEGPGALRDVGGMRSPAMLGDKFDGNSWGAGHAAAPSRPLS